MENHLESEISDLANHIWRSAGIDFSRTALDFWGMAERMVIELTADSVYLANTATNLAIENAKTWPSALRALYLYRVRELAHCMNSASIEQRERSMDFWLAAEKHLQLLAEAAARAASAHNGKKEEAVARIFETFSAIDYLEQIRKRAHQLWETAENQNRSALDFWLAAENKMVESLVSNGTASVFKTPSSQVVH